jgi:hypothetical protein
LAAAVAAVLEAELEPLGAPHLREPAEDCAEAGSPPKTATITNKRINQGRKLTAVEMSMCRGTRGFLVIVVLARRP